MLCLLHAVDIVQSFEYPDRCTCWSDLINVFKGFHLSAVSSSCFFSFITCGAKLLNADWLRQRALIIIFS